MKKMLLPLMVLLSVSAFSQKKVYMKTYKKPVKKTYRKPIVKKNQGDAFTDITPTNPTAVQNSVPVEAVKEEKSIPAEQPKENYEITAGRVLKKSGWIKNRNSVLVRGIEGFVKGVYTGGNKLYVLIEIDNHTNINYDIESASFITNPIQNGNRQIEAEEKVFVPIYTNQPESIAKKTHVKIVYVFDKFTISDNKTLLFVMNESDGERTVTLDIKPKFISGAEYVK